jgi:hypothetical protein
MLDSLSIQMIDMGRTGNRQVELILAQHQLDE